MTMMRRFAQLTLWHAFLSKVIPHFFSLKIGKMELLSSVQREAERRKSSAGELCVASGSPAT